MTSKYLFTIYHYINGNLTIINWTHKILSLQYETLKSNQIEILEASDKNTWNEILTDKLKHHAENKKEFPVNLK